MSLIHRFAGITLLVGFVCCTPEVTQAQSADTTKKEIPEVKPPRGWVENSPRLSTYSAWFPPGPVKESDKSAMTKSGQMRFFSSTYVRRDNFALIVAQMNLPAAFTKDTQKNRHDFLRDLALDEFDGKVAEEKNIEMAGLNGREVLIQTKNPREWVRMRIIGPGVQIYRVVAIGTKAQVNSADADSFFDCFRRVSRIKVEATTKNGETEIVGGFRDPIFREYAPEKSYLVGFELGITRSSISAARPIFRGKSGETLGEPHGVGMESRTITAKEGYAVGMITVSTTGSIDGLLITFMKLDGDKLDPKDSYDSEWIGGMKRNEKKLTGEGTPLIGIVGRAQAASNNLTGLGLILNTPDALQAKKDWSRGKDTQILGGDGDLLYRDLAPEGGILIGLEIGLDGSDNLKGVRPIFRTGDKESLGKQHGTEHKRVVTFKAKPGYAVGAISLRAGGRADGLTVTFMKIVKGGLNPEDSYDSDYAGTREPKQPKLISGGGKTVIGIAGKESGSINTGLGLVLESAQK